MYKAIENIGGYKVGDEVPEEKAIVWAKMYVKSPVEKIVDDAPAAESNTAADPEVPDAVAPEEPTAESVNAMHDDYINRNADVVIKAIDNDNLNKSTLESLLRLENSDKKRKKVIEAIKLKIDSLN